jgi:hypothetical protein
MSALFGCLEVGLFGPYWTEHWRAVRHAVLAAVLPAEPRDAYLVLMVRGLTFSGSIEHELEADSRLLTSEVSDLFQPRPLVQRALVGGDSYHDAANTWNAALVRLAQRGLLDSHALREHAARASTESEIALGHRRWFRRLAHLLEHPDELPAPHGGGTPPPGNRLRGKRYEASAES